MTAMCAETALPASEISPKKLRFGDFTFDFSAGELRRGGDAVPLRPRALLVLGLLLSRPGEIVSHAELRSAVWGETTVEWQDGLHQIIRELRNVLGDNPQRPVFIETLHRRGYRFRAPVEPVEPVTGRSHADNSRAMGKIRNVLLFGAGAMSLPALVLLVCVFIGLSA